MRGANLYVRPNQDRACRLCKAARAKARQKGGVHYGQTIEYALERMFTDDRYYLMWIDAGYDP